MFKFVYETKNKSLLPLLIAFIIVLTFLTISGVLGSIHGTVLISIMIALIYSTILENKIVIIYKNNKLRFYFQNIKNRKTHHKFITGKS